MRNSITRPLWLLGSLLFLFISTALGQQQPVREKPPLDASVFDKWPSIGSIDISNDGNYVLYTIRNKPVRNQTLVIRATNSAWRVERETAGEGIITQDNRNAVFIRPDDHLCLLKLGTSFTECIADVKSYHLVKQATSELLVYRLKSPAEALVVRELSTDRTNKFEAVSAYSFSNNGKVLLLQTPSRDGDATSRTLKWVNLDDGKIHTIWQGTKAEGFAFDANDTQVAFIAALTANNPTEKSLWYYKAGTERAVLLADDRKVAAETGLSLDALRWQAFASDGGRLFVQLKEKNLPVAKPEAVKVDIWSYNDPKLQSQQLHELDPKKDPGAGPRTFAAVVRVRDGHINRLERENDRMRFPIGNSNQHSALVLQAKGDTENEWNWNPAASADVYLVSIVDGSKRLLAEKVPGRVANTYALSPGGKYVIWYSPEEKDYFAYVVASGAVHNITRGTSRIWGHHDRIDEPKPSRRMTRGFAGWLKDDSGVLIYDQHDIFRVDPSGRFPPVNITNGYGAKHNIEFKVTRSPQSEALSANDRLVLTAFNRTNKESGFYAITLGKNGNPELLTMQPYLFGPYEHDNPKKARDAEIFLVRRMSAAESPNYFWTKDFKTFAPVSDLYPEKAFNWLKAELVTWKSLDGGALQGALYKPENFDPTKKYPVIIHYYERLSDELHEFTVPDASIGPMNIPYFASNGYLVFTPDIHYTIGYPGKSAFNSIVSAANHLSKMPWVDATKIGLQGHSFGGFETLYLITHTNMFAAAMASSPMSNFISAYGSIIGDGSSRQRQYELYRDRVGATLWERPDLYIENSPVLRADKVTTPLLMMSNKNDGDVPFPQGVEMFTALRRLGKKSWMLQYDEQDHMAFDKDAEDLTIRMKQFFDHYLKGAPPPKWMTEGVPARLKGVESGLELDKSGKTP